MTLRKVTISIRTHNKYASLSITTLSKMTLYKTTLVNTLAYFDTVTLARIKADTSLDSRVNVETK